MRAIFKSFQLILWLNHNIANITVEKREEISKKRMSVIFSCGFSRVAVKESFHKPGSVAKETDPVQRWKNYLELLDESARAKLAVERTLFMKKSRIIYDLFRKMNSQNRNEYLQYFSLANWKALPQSQKSERHDIEL